MHYNASASLLYGVIPFDIIQNAEQVLYRFGTEHGDTRFLEVRNAFEHRRVGQMAAYMKDATAFVQ